MGVIYTHLVSSDNVADIKMNWTEDQFKEIFGATSKDFRYTTDMEDSVVQMFDYSSSTCTKDKLQKVALHMVCPDKNPRCICFATDLDYSLFAVVFYPGQSRICRYSYKMDVEEIEEDDEEDEDDDFYDRLHEYQTLICMDALRGHRDGWEKWEK